MLKSGQLYFVLALFIAMSCKRANENNSIIEDEEIDSKIEQLNEMKKVYYRFPSPNEMLTFIETEEVLFDNRILSPVDNAKRYLDSRNQALNLGVYLADLAYIGLFQQQKESMIYFQTVYGLSRKLRLESAYDPKLLKRFERNMKEPDSLKVLTDEAIDHIIFYLTENNKEKTFAIVSVGGYIESLYLAFQVVGEYSSDNMVVQHISDQKLVLENLVNYSLEYADDPNVSESIKLLHPIRHIYNKLRVKNEKTKVEKDEEGKIVISGGSQIYINEEQFNELRDVTFNLRKKIIENLDN